MSQQNYSPVNVYPSIPPTTDILCGAVNTTTGTIITVPVGRAWSGSVNISANLQRSPASFGGTIFLAQVPVFVSSGGGTIPAGQVVATASLVMGVTTSTSVDPVVVTSNVTVPNVLVVAGTTAATLQADSTAQGATQFLITCVGTLL